MLAYFNSLKHPLSGPNYTPGLTFKKGSQAFNEIEFLGKFKNTFTHDTNLSPQMALKLTIYTTKRYLKVRN